MAKILKNQCQYQVSYLLFWLNCLKKSIKQVFQKENYCAQCKRIRQQVLCPGLVNQKCCERNLENQRDISEVTSKIKNIQKIIHEDNKPKPYINITIKGLLCKQVIVSINNENKNEFIKNLSNYVININRLLKNIKSKCKEDYRSQVSLLLLTKLHQFQIFRLSNDMSKVQTRLMLIKSRLCAFYNPSHTCHMQVHLFRNYISAVKSPPKHTSPPSSQHIL